jgi:radical SAM protein with 4Fe4S-binding SPASM domain
MLMRERPMREVEIRSVRSGEIGTNFSAFVAAHRTPVSGSIELLHPCNLKCVHCYCPPGQGNELSLEEIRRIMDEAAAEGLLWLLITGGEPLFRPDFLDIYSHVKSLGIFVNLFTNGTMITEKIADHFARYPPFSIEISLYGATEETYEQVTGVKGSYRRCLLGIERIVARKLPLKLKTPVMTLNRHELDDIQAIAERYGLAFRYDPVITARMDGDRGPLQYRLSPAEVLEIDTTQSDTAQAWEERCSTPDALLPPDNVFTCGAGHTSFHIDPYGGLHGCLMTRKIGFNLREMRFRDAFQKIFPALAGKRDADSKCNGCDVHDTCGRCPGFAEWENGDHHSHVDYLCDIGNRRKEVFAPREDGSISLSVLQGEGGAGCGSGGAACGA